MLIFQNDSHGPFYNRAYEGFVFLSYPDDDVFCLWQNSPVVVVSS